MFFFAAIFAAFMVYVLLMILCATFKIIIRVIKGKLSPDNVHDVNIYINVYYYMEPYVHFSYAEYCIFPGLGQTSRSRNIKSNYWDKQI